MDIAEKIKLMGQMVEVVGIYVKISQPDIPGNIRPTGKWERKELDRRVGWITGHRHLKNGYMHWSGHPENDYVFVATEQIPCFMVVFWPTQNPIPVPIGDILCHDDKTLKPEMGHT